MKRSIHFLIVMLVMSVTSYAQSILNSGTIGGMLNWTVYDDGRLTLDGSGSIPDFSSSSDVPWSQNSAAITSVELSGDISSIGKFAFYFCMNVTKITSTILTAPTLAANTFNSSRLSSITLYVPSMYMTNYQGTLYWNEMQVMPSDGGNPTGSSAYLSAIYVDGTVIDGFDRYTFEYQVQLPDGTTTAPNVTYQAEDESAIISVSQADSPNGFAKIIVESSDGTMTNTYQITFTATTGGTPTGGDDDPQLYIVYWSVNGNVNSNQSVEAGSFIDMTPEAPMPSDCIGYGYTFIGWTESPISGSQGWEPTPLYTNVSDFPSVTQDITYYAVFRSDATAGGGTYEMYVTSCSSTPAGGDATSGTLTSGQSWSLDDGRLSITGGGDIAGFEDPEGVPWYNRRNEITYLFLGADFFSIGAYVFYDLENLTSISCPSSYMPTIVANTFNPNKISQITATVRANLLSQYQADTYWKQMTLDTYPDSGGDKPTIIAEGYFGDGDALHWALYSDGQMNIDGEGYIPNYTIDTTPWGSYVSDITSVQMSGVVSSIGQYAFYGCTNLTYVYIPYSVSVMSDYAFGNCYNLNQITSDAAYAPTVRSTTFNNISVSYINLSVPCGSTESYQAAVIWQDMNISSQACGNSGNEPVTLIADGYIGDGDALHWTVYSDGQMIIEGTAESIPEYTTGANDQPWYDYRETITELIINSNSSIIGNNAFAGLYKLQSVTFPEDMYLLGDYSFSGCYELSSITVRGTINVMSATTETFDGISDLTAINLYVPASMYSQYRASEFWSRMRVMPTDASGTVNVNTSWTLHNGVLSFSGDAMESIPYFSSMDGQPWGEYRESILAVDMSGAPLMNEIGGYAFAGCTALTQVIMPQSLTYVGGYAFLYCNSLSRIDMLTLEQVGVAEDAFDGLQTESIKLVVADSMVAVYQSASVWGNMNVTPLSEVSSGGDDQPQVIARGYLGDGDALVWRFYDNGQLTFDGEGAIPDFPDISYQPWSEYRSQITEVIMNADIPSVGDYAFSACDNLTTVTLSSSTTQLGSYTFSDCPNLVFIIAPVDDVMSASELVFGSYIDREQLKIAVPASQVQSYQGAMFWYEYNIIAISVSDGGLIENELYWGFNDSVLTIYGTGAMPDWIQSMAPWGDYVDQVKTVFVNSGVTYVCNGAFYGCENLTEVTFAETVDTVGSQIFSSNNYPISLYPQRMMPPGIAEDAFANVNGCVYVYCYESAYSEYESHPVWGTTCMGFVDNPAPELEPYQLEYIFVNMIGIRGYDPNIYTYDVTIPIDSGVPSVQFSRGNYDQDITCEQATSLPGTAYIHIAINGTRMATYTINFLVEGGADPQGETVVIALDSSWRFIMLPSAIDSMVTASDITIDGEVEWATYNGYKRAAGQSGWETENFESSYNLERGHIVRAVHDTATIIIKLPANLNQQSASLNLALYPSTHAENANWNLLGNPYSAGYRIAGLEAVGIESPITVWNGTGYTTYTPGIDDYVLQPFEAFFIQHTEDGAARLNLFPTYVEQ